MKASRLMLIVSLFSLTSFAGKIEISPEGNRVTKPGVLSMAAEWVKDKGKKYDIGFQIKNDHTSPIIVFLNDMRCFRGNTEGRLKHTFFNTGEKTMDFRVNELKNLTLVCQIGQEVTGDYHIIVSKVHENPGGDGRTLGKVIGKDIKWSVSIAP